MDVAAALKWVKENIADYDGDNSKIFVSGHSAGGHLAALVSTDSRYFDSLNIPSPIRGTILIDPFGLNNPAPGPLKDVFPLLKEAKRGQRS